MIAHKLIFAISMDPHTYARLGFDHLAYSRFTSVWITDTSHTENSHFIFSKDEWISWISKYHLVSSGTWPRKVKLRNRKAVNAGKKDM